MAAIHKYIKVFETADDYNRAYSSLDRPNVSYIEENGEVVYNDVERVTSILFEEYQSFTNNTVFGETHGYDSSEELILGFNDPSGTGTSSVSEMIQLDSVVSDNFGNDITADCTFTYSGDWHYSEEMCDDGEGNETPCNQGLWNYIGVDDNQTPYAGELIASYTTSGGLTFTSSLSFSWTQTSDGQDPGE